MEKLNKILVKKKKSSSLGYQDKGREKNEKVLLEK